MDKILIAEDNPVLLKILTAGLKKYEKKFETITAMNGQEAIEILEQTPVDLLITDIQMPKVDGLALLAYMNENHPEVPCIVMTAHGTPQLKEKLRKDVLRFIEKPFEIEDLVKTILPALKRDVPEGTLLGISVTSFLQMIEMEQKTCLLEVESEKGKGFFYFEDGVLYDAVYGEAKGLEAALRLIPMDNAKIRFKNVGKVKKRIARRINQELISLIMEAMRLKDEGADETKEFDLQSYTSGLTNTAQEAVGIVEADLRETEKAVSEAYGEKTTVDVAEMETRRKETVFTPVREEAVINLKTHVGRLKTISGYRATAIMNHTGEILESDAADDAVDINYISAVFNDIFLSADRACDRIGFDSAAETTVVTPKGNIIIRSSDPGAGTHIHVITILHPKGNVALMKMEMERILPAVVAALD